MGITGTVGSSKRYAEHYDQITRERLAAAPSTPCTLPQQAYGPQKIEWVPTGSARPPVWVWLSWPDRPAERVAAFAAGWNDRVTIIAWDGPRGEQTTVVWRNAVTKRTAS